MDNDQVESREQGEITAAEELEEVEARGGLNLYTRDHVASCQLIIRGW